MIIKLSKDTDIFTYEEALGIHHRPLSHLVSKIVANYASEQSVEIQIHLSLLSEGYRINPSMFGQHVRAKVTEFMFTKCMKRDNFVIILCTNDPTPISFVERIRQCVTDNVPLEVSIDEIPMTYRHQVHLLRYRIKQDTGFKLKIKQLKTKHVYSRA